MIDQPHATSVIELARALETDLELGLTNEEVLRRLDVHGPNRPERQQRPPYLRLALNQLADPLVGLLIAAAIISASIGHEAEGIAIAVILVLNGALGFWQESEAERAILALSEGFTQSAVLVRDGSEHVIRAEDVVPGDLMRIAAGDRIAADARLVEISSLEVDESALTGESLPVGKQTRAVARETPLAERTSMVYAGTGVVHGDGLALVCTTGPHTEAGMVERLAAAAKAPTTPLTRRLGRLARQMVVIGITITFVLGAIILIRGGSSTDAFLIAVAVAVAAVPEGLAATVTAALALGARAMARRGAIVRQLIAIETLGETSVICTDKTGTLTENVIRVAAFRPAPAISEQQLLEAAVLASTARHIEGRLVGDPIETALLLAALERGIRPDELQTSYRRIHEIPFSSDRKRMTIVYEQAHGRRAFSKGAPEVLAQLAAATPAELLETSEAWADEGLRVLAIARREVRLTEDVRQDDIEHDLQLLGVIALHDPLRASAEAAVEATRRAGISVQMLTGDHPATAQTIGRALGLPAAAILARATPADKLALVTNLQRRGETVAATGDGINDAPALRQADVGIAMGRTGTEAAREAAAIVLTDDDFATIVAAIAEGRRIGDNIRKFVAFLLSANLGEVLVFAVAIGAGLGSPLTVIQILLVNLVTDGLPALALARDPASEETMRSPPRRGDSLFDADTWLVLLFIGMFVGASTFAAFVVGRALGDGATQTMTFATLALAELALVYGIRSISTPAWRLPGNRWLNLTVTASVALVAALVFLPQAHGPFATTALDPLPTLIVVALALTPIVALELMKRTRLSLRQSVVRGSRSGSATDDAPTSCRDPLARHGEDVESMRSGASTFRSRRRRD